MELRPYQQACISAITSHGNGRWLCQLATGLGKTVIFSQIPRHGKTLILSHRQELVHQPLKYFTCPKSVEMGSLHADSSSEVVSASIQTLTRRKEKFAPNEFDTIIIDECHHAASKGYQEVLNYFRPYRLLGFTATPNRADGKGLNSVFTDIIFRCDIKWGIENGWLSRIKAMRVNIGYDLTGVNTRLGDFAEGELAKVVDTDRINNAVAQAYKEYALKPAIVFAVNVEHAHHLAEAIGDGAVAVDANTPREVRAKILDDFREGKINCLVNCALFTEGTDLPNIRTVIMARPTQSQALYTQMVGRGTRLYPGKDYMLLIDCVGASCQHPICTAPTLLGISDTLVAPGRQTEIFGDLLDDVPELVAQLSDSPLSWIKSIKEVRLWERTSGYDLRDLQYIRLCDGSIVLTLERAWIHISAPDLTGKNTLTTSGGYTHHDEAQNNYDLSYRLVNDRFAEQYLLWSRKSVKGWKSDDATPGQYQMIHRLGGSLQLPERLNKLEAHAIITNLKYKGLKK